MLLLSAVLCLIAAQFGLAVHPNKTSTIHFGAFVPYLEYFIDYDLPYGKDRFGYKTAIDMAVEIINNRSDILPHYKIQVHYGETFGDAPVALKSLIDFVTIGPTKIGLIGPAYSEAANPVADVGLVYAIPQITYASLLPKLMNRKKYPYFFRTTPSMLSFNDAKLAWLKYFKWARVGLLYDYSFTLHFEAIDKLQKLLKENGIEVVAIEGFSSDYGGTAAVEVKKLKDLDARVIFTEVSKWGAQSIFCEAYRQGMYGDKYVWFTSGALEANWYQNMKPFNYCNPDQLMTAIEGYFYVTRLDLRTDGKRAQSGLTAPEFYTALKKRIPHAYTFASFAFDAVWVFANSLHEISKNYNLTKYKYRDPRFSYLVYAKKILEAKFEAISGPLRFNKSSERLGFVMIGQFMNGSLNEVALHSSTAGNLTFYPGKRLSLFNGKPPPLDHTIKTYVAKTLSTPVIAVMWSFAAFGLFVSCFFLYFNIRYRENRLIKMSSPMINNVIIIGSILSYVAVIIFGLDTRLIAKSGISRMCNAFVWVLTIGFTLSFGALFSKTWRVYKIFTAAKSMERVAILDRHLFGIIFVLLGVDVILLAMWMFLSPYNLKTTEVSQFGNVLRDIIEVTQVHHCSAKFGLHFSSATIAYKGILLFFGLFLAWETRHVEVPALNDSKYIGMAVYNVAAISAIGVTCTYALSDAASNEASYTIVCLCIILCTTVTLCLVFLPKLTLLFSKDMDIAAETSRFSTLKNRPVSTISATGKPHTRDNTRNGTLSMNHQTKHKQSVTTLSSFASLSNDFGLNSFDTKAWSASMSELSSSYKSEEALASSHVSSTLPNNARKFVDSGKRMSFNNHIFSKSGSMCQLTGHKRKVSDAPSCHDVTEVATTTIDECNSTSSLANTEPAVDNAGFTPKLPNGVSMEKESQLESDVTPRILPSDATDAIFESESNGSKMNGDASICKEDDSVHNHNHDSQNCADLLNQSAAVA